MIRFREAKASATRFWRANPFERCLLLAGLVIALLSVCASPRLSSLLLVVGGWVLLVLVSVLRRVGHKVRWLSLRIHPGLVVMLATLWMLLLLSELLLRALFFSAFPNDLDRIGRWVKGVGYQYDQTLGWFPTPNSHLVFSAERTVSVDHNSRGLRDPEPVFDKRPRIVFLGDSFVWGYNVNAAERFTDKISSRHPDWAVFNFGVCGYGTDQEYLLLQRYFSEYQPQLLFLVYCTLNDDQDNLNSGDPAWYYKPYFMVETNGLQLHGVPVPHSERAFHLRHPLLSKLYLVRLTLRAWNNFWHPPPHRHASPTPALIAAVRDYVESHGAAFYVGLTGTDPKIEAFLKRSNISYVDLSTDLRVPYDSHWSPEGHTFVAGKIEEFLAGKFPKAGSTAVSSSVPARSPTSP